MIGTLEGYKEAGRQAARAMNQKDGSRYDFHRAWFRGARNLEDPADWPAIDEAYRSGYDECRVVPPVTYFR